MFCIFYVLESFFCIQSYISVTHYVNVSTCANGFSECLKDTHVKKTQIGGVWVALLHILLSSTGGKAIWSNLFLHPTRPYHISSVSLGIGANGSELKMPTHEAFFRDGRTSGATLFWGGLAANYNWVDVNERRIPLGIPFLDSQFGIGAFLADFWWYVFWGCLGCAASSSWLHGTNASTGLATALRPPASLGGALIHDVGGLICHHSHSKSAFLGAVDLQKTSGLLFGTWTEV